ncbi:MAG: hypothetical protein AAGD05_18955, partial [Bacteroidota bacterium]
KKVWLKGGELGPQFLLKDRVLYHYQKDSLTGETHFSYTLSNIKASAQKRKIIYRYDAKTGKRHKRLEYDFDGSLRSESTYHYDHKQRLQYRVRYYPLSESKQFLERKYKAGKIWQEINQVGNKRAVKVYVDGRLIRLRTYFGDQIFSIVDYQYLYFDAP